MKKTFFLVLLIMFSFISFGAMQSSEWNFDQLTILNTNQESISGSNNNQLTFNIVDSSGSTLTNTLVSCDFYLYNLSNQLILSNALTNDANGVDKSISLTTITDFSEYSYKVLCNSSTEDGFLVNNFQLTIIGEPSYNITLNDPHMFYIEARHTPEDTIKETWNTYMMLLGFIVLIFIMRLLITFMETFRKVVL